MRLSFSSAIRNPTLADQYLYYNVGRAILIGNIDGFDSLVTIGSIQDYFSVVSPLRSSLVYFNAPPVKPEKVKSAEIGYRTTLFNNLFFDGSYYYSQYTDFLGYKLGGDVTFDHIYQNNISGATFYRVAANSDEVVITQGASGGLTYYFAKYFSITGNYSWNELKKVSAEDDIIPAYNTPKHKYNIGISGRDIITPIFKNFGFSINYKWVEGFLYEGSPQFTGDVPTYDMLDVQINKTIPKIHTTFKLGASNILDNKMFQVYGGPRIGRMAYFSILLELDRK